MDDTPLFSSAEQAVSVLWPFTIRLAKLLALTAIALLHTTLLALTLLGLWAAQVTPADMASAGRQILHAWPAAALGTAGVSAATLAGAYWWLVKRLLQALASPLAAHLLRGPRVS